LAERLPADTLADAATIVAGGSTTQMTYLVGTPTRDAINYAWSVSQKYGCITATALLALGYPAIFIWKNYNVDKRQNKGTLM
jgi:hypothetical protein